MEYKFSPAKVAKRRGTQGLTQQGLAEKAGLSVTTIALLEAGKKEPLVNTLAKVSVALNIDISYFFTH